MHTASDGLRKVMLGSFGVHISVVVVLFVLPRGWFVRETPIQIPMTLSMGSPGEKTGGLNPAGAQPIQEVAPPPKRPEPQQVVTPPKAPDPIAVAAKSPPKTTPKLAETPPAPPSPTRPPITGARVTPGTAVAATGSAGQNTGLSVGGGAGGTTAQLDISFCCPDYAKELVRRIEARWNKPSTDEVGETTLVFEIRRDGSFAKPQIEKSSGSVMLDLAAQSAFVDLKFPPLPEQFSGPTLKIHMNFPYKR